MGLLDYLDHAAEPLRAQAIPTYGHAELLLSDPDGVAAFCATGAIGYGGSSYGSEIELQLERGTCRDESEGEHVGTLWLERRQLSAPAGS